MGDSQAVFLCDQSAGFAWRELPYALSGPQDDVEPDIEAGGWPQPAAPGAGCGGGAAAASSMSVFAWRLLRVQFCARPAEVCSRRMPLLAPACPCRCATAAVPHTGLHAAAQSFLLRPPSQAGAQYVAWNASSTLLAVSSDVLHAVFVFEPASGRRLLRVEGHRRPCLWCAGGEQRRGGAPGQGVRH